VGMGPWQKAAGCHFHTDLEKVTARRRGCFHKSEALAREWMLNRFSDTSHIAIPLLTSKLSGWIPRVKARIATLTS
jgi:hypothetical protein